MKKIIWNGWLKGLQKMMKFNEKQICPKCGESMLMMYGCGWDYDRLICGSPKCDYEFEFETTSYPNA